MAVLETLVKVNKSVEQVWAFITNLEHQMLATPKKAIEE